MTTKTPKIKKHEITYILRRFSIFRLTIFVFILFAVLIVTQATMTEKTDFPAEQLSFDFENKWQADEHFQLYSYFDREVRKIEIWIAYKAALKLKNPDDNSVIKSSDVDEVLEILHKSTPKLLQSFKEEKIDYDVFVKKIKQEYYALNPCKIEANIELSSHEPPNTSLEELPDWIFVSGFKSGVAKNNRKFNKYLSFLEQKISRDLSTENKHGFLNFLRDFQYSFRQLIYRNSLREIGEKIISNSGKNLCFKDKTTALIQLFNFVRDMIAIVDSDFDYESTFPLTSIVRGFTQIEAVNYLFSQTLIKIPAGVKYTPTFPLDTLFKGFGDIESINFLFSELVSATLNINCFEIVPAVSNKILDNSEKDQRLLCVLVKNPDNKRLNLYAFDFYSGVPILTTQGELLNLIDYYTFENRPEIIDDLAKSLKNLHHSQLYFYANPLQFRELLISRYLQYDKGLNVNSLPFETSELIKILFVNEINDADNYEEFLSLPLNLHALQISKLPFFLAKVTNKDNRKYYGAKLLSNSAVKMNLNYREIAFAFNWLDDAIGEFGSMESSYFGYEEVTDFIKKVGFPKLEFSNFGTTFIPFNNSNIEYKFRLYEAKKQLKLKILQSLYQVGLLEFYRGEKRQAMISLTDFIRTAASDKLLDLSKNSFPGCFINQAKLLLGKCLSENGDKSGAFRYLNEVGSSENRFIAAQLFMKYPEIYMETRLLQAQKFSQTQKK